MSRQKQVQKQFASLAVHFANKICKHCMALQKQADNNPNPSRPLPDGLETHGPAIMAGLVLVLLGIMTDEEGDENGRDAMMFAAGLLKGIDFPKSNLARVNLMKMLDRMGVKDKRHLLN